MLQKREGLILNDNSAQKNAWNCFVCQAWDRPVPLWGILLPSPVLQRCVGLLFVQLVQLNRESDNNGAVCLIREACWEWAYVMGFNLSLWYA